MQHIYLFILYVYYLHIRFEISFTYLTYLHYTGTDVHISIRECTHTHIFYSLKPTIHKYLLNNSYNIYIYYLQEYFCFILFLLTYVIRITFFWVKYWIQKRKTVFQVILFTVGPAVTSQMLASVKSEKNHVVKIEKTH